MTEQQSWVADACRWFIDTIYGHPKSYGFWGFFLLPALVWLKLLSMLTGHLTSFTQYGDPETPGQLTSEVARATDIGFVQTWLFPNPAFESTTLTALLTVPLLFAFPWYLYRQWENRSYYRRMYGSFYHRP